MHRRERYVFVVVSCGCVSSPLLAGQARGHRLLLLPNSLGHQNESLVICGPLTGLSAGNGLHRSLAPTEAVSQAHRSAVQRAVPFGRTYFLVSSYFSTPSASEFHCSADRSITRLLWGSSVLAANSAHAALWRGNRPLKIPWQPRFRWTYRHDGSIATTGSGSREVSRR